MSANKCKNVLVLLSGGIDSSTCLEYYISRAFKVSALFIDYCQPYAEKEFTAASAIADHYGVYLKKITISDCIVPEGYIPARNAVLLNLALMNFNYECGIISLGIHAGTPYIDCTPDFKNAMQHVYDLYTNGIISIDTPFLNWTKREIWVYAKMQKIPLHLTHSNNLADLQQFICEKDFIR